MAESASQFSQLKDFLGYLATVSGDLSNVTAPPFVLARKSATELPAAWCSHQDLFLEQGAPAEPELRALAVLKNFLASLKTQTYMGTSESDGAKKPLNAYLGELFLAEFDAGEGDKPTKLVSEQVSHHPPVTACYLYNEKHGISAEGYVSQETTFSPTHGVKVNQIGHALISLAAHNETHLLTLPTLNVKGLLTGSPYPELSGTCYITSTSGYTSKIEFEGKKLLGLTGSKNSVTATLSHNDAPDAPLFRVEGQWNTSFSVHDLRHNGKDSNGDKSTSEKDPLATIDIASLRETPLNPAPLEQQDPWETRKAWGGVFAAIDKGDVRGVAAHKGALEQAQRDMRAAETKEGKEWERRFFKRVQKDDLAQQLAARVGQELNTARTDGIWRFIGVEEADKIKPPYHAGVEPAGPAKQ